MAKQYQHVGFHFAVSFNGLQQGYDSVDARFQSVSGLDVQIQTETIKEGGENNFEHNVPTRRKYTDLVLKRGIFSPQDGSIITKWCLNAFEKFELNQKKEGNNKANDAMKMAILPIDLDVALLDENHKVLFKWKVIHAWPKHWKMGELNAERSEVLIETIELNYNRFEFSNP